MGETKVQGCEEKEKVLLLWERALMLFYENDTELFVTGAQERTIAGKIAMHMDKIYREIFPMPELVIDIEYNRMDTGIKPKYPGSEDKKKRWTAPDIVLHKRRSINYNIFCCEMKKASKPGQGDARKVKRLVRHINYHFGIDLYKINRTEARFTLYYLRTGYKQSRYKTSWKKGLVPAFPFVSNRLFVAALWLGTAVLLRVFRFKNHINIPASGLQFVVVIFEIGVAFVLCGLSRKQLFFFCS